MSALMYKKQNSSNCRLLKTVPGMLSIQYSQLILVALITLVDRKSRKVKLSNHGLHVLKRKVGHITAYRFINDWGYFIGKMN